MSQEYDRFTMVAQLGNDLALDEQQQKLALAQQQLVLAQQRAAQQLAPIGATTEQTTTVGVDPSAMARASSAQSFVSQWDGMELSPDTAVSEDSLTVSQSSLGAKEIKEDRFAR